MDSECLLEADPEGLLFGFIEAMSLFIVQTRNGDAAFLFVEHSGLLWPGGEQEDGCNTNDCSN